MKKPVVETLYDVKVFRLEGYKAAAVLGEDGSFSSFISVVDGRTVHPQMRTRKLYEEEYLKYRETPQAA